MPGFSANKGGFPMEVIAWTFMAVGLYVWSRSIWASIAALGFVAGVWMFGIRRVNEIIAVLQSAKEVESSELLELGRGLGALRRHLDELQPELLARLDSLTAMVEFVGEQSHPNFANAVKSFKDAQEEEIRKKAQKDNEERRFRESLDASVGNARAEREREANR